MNHIYSFFFQFELATIVRQCNLVYRRIGYVVFARNNGTTLQARAQYQTMLWKSAGKPSPPTLANEQFWLEKESKHGQHEYFNSFRAFTIKTCCSVLKSSKAVFFVLGSNLFRNRIVIAKLPL